MARSVLKTNSSPMARSARKSRGDAPFYESSSVWSSAHQPRVPHESASAATTCTRWCTPREGAHAARLHNGLDVDTDAEVDEAWRACHSQAAKWGLHDIDKPSARHGTTASFLGRRRQRLGNPLQSQGGYTWIFEQGDLEGRGHFDRASVTTPGCEEGNRMRAAYYERKGPASKVLVLGELPTAARAGRSRVKAEFFGNQSDRHQLRGGWDGSTEMPFPRVIPHQDGAGVVDAVGPGVPRSRIGERVWIYEAQRGALSNRGRIRRDPFAECGCASESATSRPEPASASPG